MYLRVLGTWTPYCVQYACGRRPRNYGSIPLKGHEIFRYLMSHWLWGPHNGFRTGGDAFLRVKEPLREADHAPTSSTVMRRLTTRIRSEKCVVRSFRRRSYVIECTYTNLDSIAYCTPKL